MTGRVGPKVKPGLSTFTTHPSDLKAFIKPLFVEAQTMIPAEQWGTTPVYLKATAGMRLVTPEQERVVYDTVFAFLSSTPDVCPFSVARGDLRTISGGEEGYFGALSANYLSGVIDKDRDLLHPDHAGAVLGALDLGGSSTQVSLHTPPASGADQRLDDGDFFVHSYLGFGVEKMAEKYTAWATARGKGFTDPCLPPGYEGVTGVGSGDYAACKRAVTAALGLDCGGGRCVMDGVALPAVGPDAKFIGMSVYFFASRTIYAALLKAQGGAMSWPSPSLLEYRDSASAFCALPWSRMAGLAGEDGWERFMGDEAQRLAELPDRCRQAAYIDLLLGSVFGVPPEKRNVMVSDFVADFQQQTAAARHTGSHRFLPQRTPPCPCVQFALEINSMEVEWTLGSVLAESGGAAQDPAEEAGHGVDAVILLVSALLTAGVGLFCCARVLGFGRKVGDNRRRPPEANVCPGLLAAGLASKAALLVL